MSDRSALPITAGETAPSPVRRARWLWPVALAITITLASNQSRVAGPEINHFDKVAHFLVYGLLASLLVRTSLGRRHPWLAVLAVSLFGISDEFHQSFTPGRSVALADWVADTLGASLAVVLYSFWGWYRQALEWPLFRSKRCIETAPGVVPEKAA